MTTDTLQNFGPRTRRYFEWAGFEPTVAQTPILLCRDLSIIVSGGINAGKSMISAAKVVEEFPNDLRILIERGWSMPVIYWLVGQDYSATEKEFYYLQDYFQNMGMLRRRTKKLDPGLIEITGGPTSNPVLAVIRTKSARDFRTLRSESPSGIIGCEASQIDLIAFERMKERCVARGAWMFLSGTMEGGWYPKLHQEWSVGINGKRSFSLASHTNHYYYPDGEDDERLKEYQRGSSDSSFKERFLGIPCPPQGIVFPEFRPDFHVAGVEYDDNYPVQIWEDPGYGGSTHVVLAVQVIQGQVRVIDEIYERGKVTETIIEDMVKKRPWWKGQISHYISDPHYAVQHHANTSVEDIWKRLTGLRMANRESRVRVLPRLERIHSFLKADGTTGAPQLVINPRCQGLLSEVGCGPNPLFPQLECVYLWDLDRNGTIMGETPKDEWNDGWEAVGRGLVYNFGNVTVDRKKRERVTRYGNDTRRGHRRRAGVAGQGG